MKRYISDCELQDLDPEVCTASSEEPVLSVKSTVKIPFFPLPLDLAERNHRLASGLESWPAEIRPEEELFNGTCDCEKLNCWKYQEKIGTARILTPSTIISKTQDNGIIKDIEVFVGKTETCKCTLSPDCQSLTLINVDNRSFVSYSTLTLFHSILGHGSPSCYLFSNLLKSTYAWSSTTENLSFDKFQRIIRPGEHVS